MDGEPVFTGIVGHRGSMDGEPKMSYKRLDDDDDKGIDRLNGCGHEMCEGELLSQMSFYDGSSVPRAPFLDCRSLHIEDESFFSGLDAYTRRRLVRGAAESIKKVRTGDEVVLCAIGTTTDPSDGKTVPFRERFWARVLSATPCGKVNVMPLADLHWAPVKSTEPVWYHVGSTLAVKMGENWHPPIDIGWTWDAQGQCFARV